MKALTLKTIFEAVDRMSGPTRKITARMEKFGKVAHTAAKIGAGVAKAAAAVGAAALVSGAAVGKATLAFAEKGDDIDRNAKILGLSATAYQELAYAANLADVEQEAFSAASKKLSKNLGDLKNGQGTLYAELSKTNPALARQLRTAEGTGEAYDIIATAISKETNAQKRATLAQAAFGKTGQELIPMLDGLAEKREEARRSGSIISDADIASASRLDDAMKRLKASAMGPINAALAAVAERIAPIVERVTAWIAANRELIGQRLDEALGALARIGQVVFSVFEALAPALKPLWDLILSLVPMLEAAGRIIAAIIKPIAEVVGAVARVISGKRPEGADAIDTTPIAPIAMSRSESVSKQFVDINFSNPPAGMDVSSRGKAPGVSLNLGPTMGAVGGRP